MAAMNSLEFLETARAAKEERLRQGLRSGPVYGEAPLVWYDQVFGREISPAGEVECAQALRVGSTQNALDVIFVASHANEGVLKVAEGTTITVIMLEGDKPGGEFTEVGPSICVKAPAGGLEVEPDCLVARFALGNMNKPWAKCRVKIEGGITGGTVDVALGYVAR